MRAYERAAGWAPWRLLERGTEWILAPKSELVQLLSGVRRLPLKEAMILSEEHKAVLLVTIGYRQKGGVSKARVGEIEEVKQPAFTPKRKSTNNAVTRFLGLWSTATGLVIGIMSPVKRRQNTVLFCKSFEK